MSADASVEPLAWADAVDLLARQSGVVNGRLAEKLKLAKLAVLGPSLVVAVQRGREVERLAALLAGSTAAPLVRVQSPPDVRRKSQVYRRTRRVNRMNRHMEGARV